MAGGQLSDVCGLSGPASFPLIWRCLDDARSAFDSSCLADFFPFFSPRALLPLLLLLLPTKFDAIGSGPCREFSVRATALLNMASDGMILTNHDHQIRVGVLTGKRRQSRPLPSIPCVFFTNPSPPALRLDLHASRLVFFFFLGSRSLSGVR